MPDAPTSTKSKLTFLETVYPPISNQEAVWLQTDPEVEALPRRSDFYMIAGRAEAKYENIQVDEHTHVMTLDFVVGQNFTDPVTIRLRDLPGVANSPGDGYWIEAGEKMIRIWDGPVRERDGDKVTPTNMRAEHDRLHLTYRVRIGGGEWEDVNETVRIVRVACRFGGARPYFVCPGVVNRTACGRRVAKLYGPGRYFLCRHCYRLAYASQSEDAQRRSMRRATKIRQRLGGNAGTASPLPPKPKGMWRRTYERLREQALDAEERADEALLPYVARLLAWTNNRKGNNRKGTRSFWK